MRALTAATAALLVLTATGCARNGETAQQAAEAEVRISLERTPCYGTCPVYRVSILGDGTVHYQGTAHVRQEGSATAAVEPREVRRLLDEFQQAGFSAMQESYTYGAAACGRYATDAPSAVLEITRDGETKRVQHDYGCMGAPRVLRELAGRVDQTARTAQWTGADR